MVPKSQTSALSHCKHTGSRPAKSVQFLLFWNQGTRDASRRAWHHVKLLTPLEWRVKTVKAAAELVISSLRKEPTHYLRFGLHEKYKTNWKALEGKPRKSQFCLVILGEFLLGIGWKHRAILFLNLFTFRSSVDPVLLGVVQWMRRPRSFVKGNMDLRGNWMGYNTSSVAEDPRMNGNWWCQQQTTCYSAHQFMR